MPNISPFHAFFSKVGGYSVLWIPAGALWAFAVGVQFLVGAELGFAVAVIGAVLDLATSLIAGKGFERLYGGPVAIVFGVLGSLLLLSGVVAVVVAAVVG
jgi:hypothetical protein